MVVHLTEDMNDEALDASLVAGGGQSFATDEVYEGSHSRKVTLSGNTGSSLYADSSVGTRAAGADNVVFGCALYIPSGTDLDDVTVCPATSSQFSGTHYTGIVIQPDGSADVRMASGVTSAISNVDSGTLIDTIAAGTFPFDRWFFVEVDVVFAETAVGSIDVYLDGFSVFSDSGIITTSNTWDVLTGVRGGIRVDESVGPDDYWVDYMYWASNQAPEGPPVVAPSGVVRADSVVMQVMTDPSGLIRADSGVLQVMTDTEPLSGGSVVTLALGGRRRRRIGVL